MNRLSLITFASLPYPSAEGVHMCMMAAALSKVCDFELVSPFKIWRPKTISTNLDLFGNGLDQLVHKKFLQLKPKNTFFLNLLLSKDINHVYYCRQSYGADFFLGKNRKVILELHGLPTNSDLLVLKRFFNDAGFLGLVVITEALKNDIVDRIGFLYADRIYVLPDAADIERFHYEPFERFPLEFKIGYVGSNYPGKGWEIIEKLPERCKNEFHIYGFLNPLNNHPNAIFYGKIPYSGIPSAMKTFDIGLLPNQPDVIMVGGDNIGKYTSPMKLFEYMAAGKVIIASDLPVIKEILQDGRNALLVPHNDVQAWVDAINYLSNNKHVYRTIQENAFNDVNSLYSYKARAERILEIANFK